MKSYQKQTCYPRPGVTWRNGRGVTVLHDDTVDLIMSASRSDLFLKILRSSNVGQEEVIRIEDHRKWHSRTKPEASLISTPTDPRELQPLSGGVVDTPRVLGELLPELDQDRKTAEEVEAAGKVVNKIVRWRATNKTKQKQEKVCHMKPEATTDNTPRLKKLLRIHGSPRPRRTRYVTTMVTRAMSAGQVLPNQISTPS